MKRLYIAGVALLFVQLYAAAATVRGLIVDERNEAVIGANVRWVGENTGAISDVNGAFSIASINGKTELVVSYVGYTNDTIKVTNFSQLLEIHLSANLELQEVTIAARKAGTITSRIETLQTQTINFEELCRAACCNLAESFETNPSVDVAYSDAATGAKQIRLLGLSGAYVQMLTENAPNFRGASSLYGLDYVPGAWMESIQVSKGTSSVKNGYEAMTGQINVEYKKPQTADPISVNLFAADNRRLEANVDGAIDVTKNLSTGIFAHYSNDTQAHDANGDGFLDLPQTQQVNLFNRWYYTSNKFISQLGVKYIGEERINGQTHATQDDDPYKIGIRTNRGEFFTKNAYIFDHAKGSSVALIFSGSMHDQRSSYGRTEYDFRQDNLYASLLFETELTRQHRISTGLSMNYDYLSDQLPQTLTLPNNPSLLNSRSEYVPGAYFQYTFNLNDKFVALAGLRGDWHNEYGFFVTPRLHLKWNVIEQLHWRASIGKGFRSVNALVDNSFLFASGRVRNLMIDNNLKMEEALNYGTSLTGYIPLFGNTLTLTAEYYRTQFMNQVVVDVDSNPQGVSIYNLSGESYSNNFQVEASYQPFRGMTLTAAYRITDAKTTYGGELLERPLTNRYKGLITASYQTPLKKWQFDYTVQFNGNGRMPTPDASAPLWNNEFPSYTIMNAQITKYFRTWSVYLGGENLLNFKQKSPIIGADRPWDQNFDATMIWGPVHGRKIYLGVRWSIPRDL